MVNSHTAATLSDMKKHGTSESSYMELKVESEAVYPLSEADRPGGNNTQDSVRTGAVCDVLRQTDRWQPMTSTAST
ncbi:hypothetical protein SARC_07189 [Sphaeroforma arctica JP610]|uniref:Uncharacterized protein n=1 Tax=Sphaeroforma arctica JP610 TaxID=667725 RepID=A0A0L0FUE7_9EUKA|nr:hypothetical protein SARC_07189 [Sphaeroforma arctica JP610]KNC80452.1 hypothetical protein SARC_07189 [Sphaeroforma arctica JP610]|eukprot:XP_014154354.1 hypothetical protein SARC_07189 [Sphaeroforma arctica JP610]